MASKIHMVRSALAGAKWLKHKCQGKDDPWLETVRLNGKEETVVRGNPDFIPEHDSKVLTKVKSRSRSLDSAFGLFGWESIIGLIPEIGDFIGVFLALYVYHQCRKVDGGLPDNIKRKMKKNILVDFLVGLVPIFGDIADGYFKANTRNVKLLEDHLRKKYGPKDKRARYSAGLHFWNKDKKQLEELQMAGVEPVSHNWHDEDDEVDEGPTQSRRDGRHQAGAPPGYYDQSQARQHQTQPQPPAQKQQSWWSKWFGSTTQQRPADPEMGQMRPAGAH